QHNDADGQQLRRRYAIIPYGEEIDVFIEYREQVSCKFGERYAHRSDGRRLYHGEKGPSKHEAYQWAVGLAEVYILPSCFRKHSTQSAIALCSCKCHAAAYYPDSHHPPCRSGIPYNVCGYNKYAGSNHAACYHHGRIEKPHGFAKRLRCVFHAT